MFRFFCTVDVVKGKKRLLGPILRITTLVKYLFSLPARAVKERKWNTFCVFILFLTYTDDFVTAGWDCGVRAHTALPPTTQQAHVLAHPPLAALVPPPHRQAGPRETLSMSSYVFKYHSFTVGVPESMRNLWFVSLLFFKETL